MNVTILTGDPVITLKVLRTLRTLCRAAPFDPEGDVLLSHAHQWIVNAARAVQLVEEEDNK